MKPEPKSFTKSFWFVITKEGRIRPMEHEGDYEPGDTLLRTRTDGHGNVDVLIRRTVHEVEINIKKEL